MFLVLSMISLRVVLSNCTNAIEPKIFTKPHCNDVVGHNACPATIIDYQNTKTRLLLFLTFIQETDKT